MKVGAFLLLGTMSLSFLSSCSDDDKNYDNVTPPSTEEIEATIKTGSLSGKVLALDGSALNGAKVTAVCGTKTLEATVSDGKYAFSNIDVAGTYVLTATLDGYVSATGSVEVKLGETSLYDFQLNKEAVTAEETVSKTEETTVSISSENEEIETATSDQTSDEGTLQTEDGQVATYEVTAVVPAATEENITTPTQEEAEKEKEEATQNMTEAEKQQYEEEYTAFTENSEKYYEDLAVSVTPVYSETEAQTTRATTTSVGKREFLIGSALRCNKAIKPKLTTPIELSFKLDPSMMDYVHAAKIDKNGKATVIDDAEVTKDSEGNVKIAADEFTSYALYFKIDITTTDGTTDVTFNPATYDNRYGSSDLRVQNPSYTYKSGAEITARGTSKLAAYMLEILAKELSGVKATEEVGIYPIDVTLAVGTAMDVSGTQEYKEVTITCNGITVIGRKYGKVSCSARTYNRNHTGGGN